MINSNFDCQKLSELNVKINGNPLELAIIKIEFALEQRQTLTTETSPSAAAKKALTLHYQTAISFPFIELFLRQNIQQ